MVVSITLYNVCLVHRGCSVHWEMFSKSGDVHYIGGYPVQCSVHREDTMSTSEGYHEYIRGHHDYIGGYSVHREIP